MAQHDTQVSRKLGRGAWCVIWFSWLNLAALLAVSLLLFVISENWWFSSAMTYAPRCPYLLPTVVLLAASLRYHRSSLPVNLISLAMVVVPIMGLNLPFTKWWSGNPAKDRHALKVVSCNVQGFQPDFEALLTEIGRLNPDVIAFQDAVPHPKLMETYFQSWHSIRYGEFYVASRFPVRQIATGHFAAFDRDGIIKCEIDLPTGKIVLFNLHNMTPRHGLRELDLSSPITQRGSHRMAKYLELRAEEAADVRNFVDETRTDCPTIIVGDFNMPFESSLYQQNWLGLQNAFNDAGLGYGYTFPCTRQYCWPAGVPWMRLDHILVDAAWTVQECSVGTVNGSDHRLITATLSLQSPELSAEASSGSGRTGL